MRRSNLYSRRDIENIFVTWATVFFRSMGYSETQTVKMVEQAFETFSKTFNKSDDIQTLHKPLDDDEAIN